MLLSQEVDKDVKFNEIKLGVIQPITPNCACSLDVTNETFSCRASVGEFHNTVVFRATILTDSNADNVVGIINNWVKTKPSLIVGQVILAIDPSCPALLDSTESNDCIITSQASRSSTHTGAIAGGIGAALTTVVVILIILIMLVVLCRKKRSIANGLRYAFINFLHVANFAKKVPFYSF